MHRCGNRAVAGMALMRAAVLTVEQVDVDRDGTVTNVQEKEFIGSREKILAGVCEYRNHLLIQQPSMIEFRELFCDPLNELFLWHYQMVAHPQHWKVRLVHELESTGR